jgi:hypothetical protein
METTGTIPFPFGFKQFMFTTNRAHHDSQSPLIDCNDKNRNHPFETDGFVVIIWKNKKTDINFKE